MTIGNQPGREAMTESTAAPQALFCVEELLLRVDHDMTLLRDMVDLLASGAAAQLSQLREAVSVGNAPAIARVAHVLKGALTNFSSPQVLSLATELEKAGQRADLSAAQNLMAPLADGVEHLTRALIAFVSDRDT